MSRRAISFKWLQHNLWDRLDPALLTSSKLLQTVKEKLDELSTVPLSLPVSSLTWREVVKMFQLIDLMEVPGSSWEIEEQHQYEAPPSLVAMLEELYVLASPSSDNEAYARCRLNLILISCLAAERKLINGLQSMPSIQAAPENKRPTTPCPFPVPVELKLETQLSCLVEYKGKMRCLTGQADYSLWYDGQADTIAANLLCVEAKRTGYASTAKAQCLGYMAIVNRIRKDAEKRNIVIYGICTDGRDFRFLRIDDKFQVTESPPYSWNANKYHQTIIVSTIRYIIRATTNSSPTTSPAKDGRNLEQRLSSFNFNNQFDFGIRYVDDEPLSWEEEEINDPPDLL